MKAVIQRVNYSKLKIHDEVYSEISKGLMVLLGITHEDTIDDIKSVYQSKVITSLSSNFSNFTLFLVIESNATLLSP